MTATFWAPGRVNLMGDHTDYSGGLVLPVAIHLGIELSARPAERISLVSDGEAVELPADGSGDPRGWGRYVAAVAQELADLGRPAVGLEGVLKADLPRGAGLGSSGALEVVVGLALCSVADFEPGRIELARACQRAERRAVGVPSGILDQAASLLGREGKALFLDCGTLERRWVELPRRLAILVVDSGERHSHEASGYGDRRAELEAGHPRRVRHVAAETERVRETVDALERDDLPALAALFLASHASLRDDYEVSTSKLDAIVAAALEAGAIAARMTGGGFGGSVLAVAERDPAAAVLQGTLERAGAQGWIVEASAGAVIRRRTDSRRGRA
jgi:galactokinase